MTEAQQPGRATDFVELHRLLEDTTDLFARHTPDGVCRYASAACRRLLGYAPDELVGTSAYDFVHPADTDAVVAAHTVIRATAEPHTAVYRVRHRLGHDVWLETTGYAIRDTTGTVVELQTTSRDVTQRHTAELALRESEQRFRLAMGNAPIGMALVSLDGEAVDVNDSLCAILGRTRDELMGLTFQDVTHPEDLDTDLEYVRQLLAGEIHHYTMEKRYLLPSGAVVWALLGGSLVRDDAGEALYFIAQVVDISERKADELALEQANRDLARSNAELERFAAVASHDLRSPIATIRGFLDLLHDRYEPVLDPQGRQIVEVARRVTIQMAESVEGLLVLARVGSEELELGELPLESVVQEVVEALRPVLTDAEADLRIGELPVVTGDRAQIRVLLQNLLANAARFRAPDRRLVVAIDAQQAEPFWRISVRDNGVGLDPADAERIFELFTGSRTARSAGGAGIGLSTCRRIVERHGGSIRALPAHPGARFEFTLPCAAATRPV